MSTASAREMTIKVSIPRQLHMALLKAQVANDMDWPEACIRAAELLDSNSQEFKKAVQREAQRLYKSRHMTEFNRARESISVQCYNKGYDEALSKFKYPCNVCGGTLHADPENEWKWLLEKGYLSTWGHARCHEQQR